MGQVDRFQLDSRAVWRMERIVISVDGMGEHPTWIPQYVHIVERVSGDVVDDAWFVNPGTRLGPDGKSVTLERGKPWHEERGKQR